MKITGLSPQTVRNNDLMLALPRLNPNGLSMGLIRVAKANGLQTRNFGDSCADPLTVSNRKKKSFASREVRIQSTVSNRKKKSFASREVRIQSTETSPVKAMAANCGVRFRPCIAIRKKWQFFWCTTASTNFENISQEPRKDDTASGHFVLQQIQKLRRRWEFFWCTRNKSSDPTASSTNSENISQESRKDDTASPHFILKQIQKLRKVDLSHAILGFSKGDETWVVPWTSETIFEVMLLWYSSFWIVGVWIIPILAYAAGFSKASLSYRGQALYSLLTDLAEGTVGMTILYQCLIRVHPLPYKWFFISWKGNWLINACLGCLMFPLAYMLQRGNLDLLPVSRPLTSHILEQSIVVRDPIAMLLYATVVSICAPIWEEVIFRGFLLPSLTRYMSIWSSIFVSAIAFAIAHFSFQRFLPLTFLGLIMGIVFVRSRNLLAAVLVHSLWNGFVFLELFM